MKKNNCLVFGMIIATVLAVASITSNEVVLKEPVKMDELSFDCEKATLVYCEMNILNKKINANLMLPAIVNRFVPDKTYGNDLANVKTYVAFNYYDI